MNEKPFDKYEKRGAYHWEWYNSNKFSYKDKLHMIRLHMPQHGKVLDIGGGDGVLSYLLFQHGLTVDCVDNNTHAIQLGNSMVEKTVYGSGLRGLVKKILSKTSVHSSPLIQRYKDGEINLLGVSIFDLEIVEPYDYIVCHEVIEHIPEPDELLTWIYQNMKHFAIISTPDVTNHPPHELDYNSWTPETFSSFLAPYKFEFIFKNGYDMYVKLYK